MKVKVHQAVLVVEGRERSLTRAIARQFPVAEFGKRFDLAVVDVEAPKPICKVMGSSFDKDRSDSWLLLVEDEVSGLEWQHPVLEVERTIKMVKWFDDLKAIPTVVL